MAYYRPRRLAESASNMFQIKRLRGVKCLLKYFTNETPNAKWVQRVRCVSHKSSDQVIALDIKGETLQFPHVWLRDNCQCVKCFHSSAKSRIVDWSKFNLEIKPTDVRKDGNTVTVTWDDGHKSDYNLDWLRFRSFSAGNQRNYDEQLYRPRRETWRGEAFQAICKRHDYRKIVACDDALYSWLRDLATYGVTLIRNVPSDESAIDTVVNRIGFPKQTHYGLKFVVQHVANTSNVAYLSSNLQAHTDLPYYEYCPGVNLLHCLVQTKSQGGENTLSDCHYVAEYMKIHHPEEYDLLTNVEVEWSDVGVEHGNEFHKLYRSPVICLDRRGEVTRINFSIPQRGSHFPGPIGTVKPWYRAHSIFYELNGKFSATFKVEAGDMLAFDNIRLLHGRNQYEDRGGNVRKLIGVYVDWDEIYSRLRCLKVKLDPKDCY